MKEMRTSRVRQIMKSVARRFAFGVMMVGLTWGAGLSVARAQTNCPSGIDIYNPGSTSMLSIWSPLSNGDYYLSRGWDVGTHTGRDRYSLDLSMPGSQDLGKAVFLPITGRVWAVKTSGPYGNTAMIWDPGTGVLIRLAHLDGFSSLTAYSGAGTWIGAGSKAGYIGETGCPGCGPHLHVTAYWNVKVGVKSGTHNVTEQEIFNFLSQGQTPTFAQPQKIRLIAPSDNCDLIRFSDDSRTIYTYKSGIIYPVTFDVWRSWGLSLDLRPRDGSFDQTAGQVPIRTISASQRYLVSSQLAPPRNESVFRGYQYPDVYVFRWNQKNFLSASQFGSTESYEFRWSEIQMMDQNFVDNIYPQTRR